MSKFYILSENGDGIGLALKLQDAKHEVAIDITEGRAAPRGKGMVTKQHDWEFEASPDTIIIFDCTGDGVTADLLRQQYRVFGSSTLADRLEMDRSFASSVFGKCNIRTPESEHFENWEDGADYAEHQDKKLVFKPGAEHSGVVPSYVPTSRKPVLELLSTMDRFRAKLGEQPNYELQEFIEGTDISTEAWFNGTSFVQPLNHTLETKKSWPGNLGKSGGCAGNVVWACDADCPLCRQLFNPELEKFLGDNQYGAGCIDINAVVDDNGIAYAIEFTPRFGFDAFPTLVNELLDAEPGQMLSDLSAGAVLPLPLRAGYAAGVRVSIPPWPSEEHPAESGLLVQGLRSFDHFWPMDMMLDSESNLVTSGGYGILGVATGFGDSIEAAFAEAYNVIAKMHAPEMQYRADLVEEFQKDARKLTRVFGVHI